MKIKYVITLIIIFSSMSALATFLLMNPKNITDKVITNVNITGELANNVISTNTITVVDTKNIYLTNTLSTSLGDVSFANIINRDFVDYKNQLFFNIDIGYMVQTRTAQFSIGLEYQRINNKYGFFAMMDTDKNYGFRISYARRFYKK